MIVFIPGSNGLWVNHPYPRLERFLRKLKCKHLLKNLEERAQRKIMEGMRKNALNEFGGTQEQLNQLTPSFLQDEFKDE